MQFYFQIPPYIDNRFKFTPAATRTYDHNRYTIGTPDDYVRTTSDYRHGINDARPMLYSFYHTLAPEAKYEQVKDEPDFTAGMHVTEVCKHSLCYFWGKLNNSN